MPTWKLANGAHANSYRAACLGYCIAHDIPTNFMGFAATSSDPSRTPNFRVVLLSSSSNIGRSSRLLSSVTGKLSSDIPVTADSSAWASFSASGSTAGWQALYQFDGNPGAGEVVAYLSLDDEDVDVLTVDDDNGFYFTFANDPDVAPGATGTGAINASFTGGSTTQSVTGSHTIAPNDNIVIADVTWHERTTAATSYTITATYGDTPMTLIGGSAQFDDPDGWSIQQFYLLDPPAGAQDIVGTIVSTPAATSSVGHISVNSVSYSGAGTPLPKTAHGPGTAATANTITTASVPAGALAHFCHYNQLTGAFTAYNQNQRATGTTGTKAWLIGDSAGTGAAITSTATQASTDSWLVQSFIIPKA